MKIPKKLEKFSRAARADTLAKWVSAKLLSARLPCWMSKYTNGCQNTLTSVRDFGIGIGPRGNLDQWQTAGVGDIARLAGVGDFRTSILQAVRPL